MSSEEYEQIIKEKDKEIAEAYDDGYEYGYRISLERIKELEGELEVKEIIIGEYRNLRAEFLKEIKELEDRLDKFRGIKN